MNNQGLCFVDMLFGKKKDLLRGIVIDFGAIFNNGIKPAIEKAGLRAVRSGQDQSGGIIHLPVNEYLDAASDANTRAFQSEPRVKLRSGSVKLIGSAP